MSLTSSIVIGRKELLSFAERHSSRRMRDFSGLADGEVLCSLFNLVFPSLRIRPISSQTHSLSQRANANWEALHRRFARLHIPVELLNVAALRALSTPPSSSSPSPSTTAVDTEAAFSTVVLFFFLHNMRRRVDYSAEFAMDVTDSLTAFLQSVDCIACLLLGDALDWEVLPEELGEHIRQLPAFHLTPAEQRAREEEAVRAYRALVGVKNRAGAGGGGGSGSSAASRRGSRGSSVVDMRFSHGRNEEKTSERLSSSSFTAPTAVFHVDHDTTQLGEPEHDTHEASLRLLSTSSSAPVPSQSAVVEPLRAALRREKDLQAAFIAKCEECERLKLQSVQLVSEVSELKTALAQAKLVVREERDRRDEVNGTNSVSTSAPAEAAQAPSEVQYLLADVRDPGTGVIIDAHEQANLLHCLLLESLPDAPIARTQAQQWLWAIVTACHVLETRLVTAANAIEALQRLCSHPTPRSGSANTIEGNAVGRGEVEELASAWHREEHRLRSLAARQHANMRATVERFRAREATWRRLCACVHEAGEAAFAMAECESAVELEALLARRETCYTRAEDITAELLEHSAEAGDEVGNGEFLGRDSGEGEVQSGDDVSFANACITLKTHMSLVSAERDALRQHVAQLSSQLAPLQERMNTRTASAAKHSSGRGSEGESEDALESLLRHHEEQRQWAADGAQVRLSSEYVHHIHPRPIQDGLPPPPPLTQLSGSDGNHYTTSNGYSAGYGRRSGSGSERDPERASQRSAYREGMAKLLADAA